MDHQRTKRLPPPASAVRSWAPGNGYAAQPRSHSIHRGPTTLASSRSVVRGYRYEVATPENRLRRRLASKEIVRRALTPPCQRPSLRWRNFRPTPTRFSVMSTV
ncbi:hypothetical protein BUALT_Bualt03G0132800 [Buddleja alternifolia]|uniref:Uncharacterized protein n=1 Tax=Buddleja alternifolia TaxID=168488 RepID=A0AAV6Y1T0_9LAMI|nr:hypothetical protein BUALT_Bualt03G0132800 [Buddleja alternifolia]